MLRLMPAAGACDLWHEAPIPESRLHLMGTARMGTDPARSQQTALFAGREAHRPFKEHGRYARGWLLNR
jgi:hypothetical protein